MFASAMASIIRASGAPGYSMIATIAGQIVSALLCAIYFRKPKLMKLEKESFKIDTKVLGKLLKLGISSFIDRKSVV